MDRLSAVSASATREHTLENALAGMRGEWRTMAFRVGFVGASNAAQGEDEEECLPSAVRDAGPHRVLVGIDDVQTLLDDHLIKTQNMRGSPYFKAFEGKLQLAFREHFSFSLASVLRFRQPSSG